MKPDHSWGMKMRLLEFSRGVSRKDSIISGPNQAKNMYFVELGLCKLEGVDALI